MQFDTNNKEGENITRHSLKRILEDPSIIFWDFDGVIKNSLTVKSEGYEKLFSPYGEEVSRRVRLHHEAYGGVSRYEKIPLYLSWAGETNDKKKEDEFCEKFSNLVKQAVISSTWTPGVKEYLHNRRKEQYFVLVTATPQKEIEQILESLKLSGCFREVYGAPKSKTEAICQVLKQRACSPEDALMIGDSNSDLEAANANHRGFLLKRTKYNQKLQKRFSGPSFDKIDSE